MSVVEKTKKFILDTLFPISCLSCGIDNVWICDKCLRKMQVFLFQVCPRFERMIIESGKMCQACKRENYKSKDFFLDSLIAASKYAENNLNKILYCYKYNLVRDLRVPFGKILVKAYLDHELPVPDAIVPVPLHRRRLRWRGFNQSELLAYYVSENLAPGMEIPVLKNVLVRKKHGLPQMKVKKYSERRKNIQGVFEINNKYHLESVEGSNVNGKKILLIDDVATTGATLNECARLLKSAGAKRVFALALARQEIAGKNVS